MLDNNLLYDATTIATSYDLSEIEHELQRREAIANNEQSTLYSCCDETLKKARDIYNEPSIKAEREEIIESVVKPTVLTVGYKTQKIKFSKLHIKYRE